ncbi:hypothetical protein M427DRAFT_27001 [Gonapodya prolifera JEL478]|uniref:Small acidic protein-like domain-containing protein n=1 Tax=Gonapodya prolifera (strain JEL478) TaxID=1344416 RepID=A0A139B0F0_GONPJ|nr:hypothetical protein M427DRAFT_27001 [Gonapodya prolifera JEL478]|eukprot:KXS22449.1 hypothetical protein M427DRAFT_27001 [Gonapodya prolifera JEL478]
MGKRKREKKSDTGDAEVDEEPGKTSLTSIEKRKKDREASSIATYPEKHESTPAPEPSADSKVEKKKKKRKDTSELDDGAGGKLDEVNENGAVVESEQKKKKKKKKKDNSEEQTEEEVIAETKVKEKKKKRKEDDAELPSASDEQEGHSHKKKKKRKEKSEEGDTTGGPMVKREEEQESSTDAITKADSKLKKKKKKEKRRDEGEEGADQETSEPETSDVKKTKAHRDGDVKSNPTPTNQEKKRNSEKVVGGAKSGTKEAQKQSATSGGWNDWTSVSASSLGGDEARRDKFLRLMGAKKNGLVGAGAKPSEYGNPADTSTVRRMEDDLVNEFERAQALLRQRRTGRGISLE